MRFIPTWLHGVLDYPLGLVLIAVPWLGGFADQTAAMWVPVGIGIAMIVLSAMTRYEAGMVPILPMTTHLTFDALAGMLLASSPWLFGFADRVWMPHLIVGIGEFLAAMTTQVYPRRDSALA
jgi:hypothetical protein